MSKKSLYILIVVIAIIAVVVGIYFGIFYEPKKENAVINLEELNTTLSSQEPYSELAMTDITPELLSSIYDTNTENINKVIGKMPMMNVQASMYLVVEAKEGKVDEVKKQIETLAQKEEEKWSTYLPAQYELVKNRKLGIKGNYVYLIIAENATELEKLVK